MSERFTVMLARMLSEALGPNPLDAIFPETSEAEPGARRGRVLRLAERPGAAHAMRRLSAA